MKSRQAVKAAAARRRYLRTGGALAVMAGVYASVTGFTLWPEKAGSQPGSGLPGLLGRDGPAMKRIAGHVDQRGHCYVDAIINGGATFEMLLDTGSTTPLFHRNHLMRLGVRASSLRFNQETIITPSGTTHAAPLTLREVRIGDYVVHDVAAVVTKSVGVAHNDEPLLGMSVLKDMRVELGDGTCTLLWK